MLLENRTKRRYVHTYLDKSYGVKLLILEPHTKAEIPDDVAKSWLKTGGVVEYVNPEDAKKEKEILEKENAELKAKLKEIKAEQPAKPKTTTKKSTKSTKKSTKSTK